MSRLFSTYRVLALIVGVLLVVLMVGWILELTATPGTSAYDAGERITMVVGITHGWLYIGYLITAFLLSRRLAWGIGFTLLVLAAGLIPILIFWVERKVAEVVRAAHPELARAG